MFAVPIAIDVKIRRKRGTMPCYRYSASRVQPLLLL